MKCATVLMIGDVVGEEGITAAITMLPALAVQYGADLTVVNGENAAAGYGLNAALVDVLFNAGADVITSGNHIWEKRDFWDCLDAAGHLLRPANYPAPAAGRGWVSIEKKGIPFAVINLQGRKFMNAIDCPFKCFDSVYAGLSGCYSDTENRPFVIVDFHAESTEEKEAFGFYVDGRAALVAGTHTHVQTADEKVLPCGTAYISDIGMTGADGGVIGMKVEPCLTRFVSHIQTRMECASGNPVIQGIAVRINPVSRQIIEIKRFRRAL